MVRRSTPARITDDRYFPVRVRVMLMTDDPTEQQQQEQVLYVVRARFQVVEELLMPGGWERIVVRTKHGAFEWTRGAVEERPAEASEGAPARRKRASTGQKARGVRRHG